MLCPEVWSFDSPGFNATERLQEEWTEKGRKKLFNNIQRNHETSEIVTVVLPNCTDEGQKLIKTLVKQRGSSYSVRNLSLQELINPVFIEGFVKRGKFCAISIDPDPDSGCIVSISPEGRLNLSVDKEVFQSIRLEGKPVQSNRNQLDKYVCTVNLVDGNLLRSTKNREIVHESLSSPLLPKVTLQFKWEPPTKDVCSSSAAKYFSDKGFEVRESPATLKCHEELSRRLASFIEIEDGEEVLEYLGMLALNCSQTKDDYLNSYEYSGDMIRVKNLVIIKAKGFFNSSDAQEIFGATISSLGPETPWIAINTSGFTRTPVCDRFFEIFYDISSERALTFVLNTQKKCFTHQILPIIKNFSK